jgi:uncharacterized membrane protein
VTGTDARDAAFGRRLGFVLRAGVLSAAAIVAVGAVVYLSRRGMDPVDYQNFRGAPPEFRSVRGILAGVQAFNGRGLIQLGLLLLIATPVARVVFSIVAFVRQQDWLYVAISTIVRVLLGASLFGG